MAYVSPGGAFSSAIQDALLARDELQLKHAQLDIQEKQLARETAKDLADQQARQEEDAQSKHEAETKEVTDELKNYTKGDYLPPELLKKAKALNISIPSVPDPEAVASTTGASALGTGAPLGATQKPVAIRFAGSPAERKTDEVQAQLLSEVPKAYTNPTDQARASMAIRMGQTPPAPSIAEPLEGYQGMKDPGGKLYKGNVKLDKATGAYQLNGKAVPGDWVPEKSPPEVNQEVLEMRRQAEQDKKDKETNDESTLTEFQKDNAALNMAALAYRKTEALPPMGMGPAGAKIRTMIIQRAAHLNADGSYTDPQSRITYPAGPDIALNKAQYQANSQALNQLTKNLVSVKAFAATADRNQELLNQTLKGVPDTGVTLLNKPIRSVVKDLGSDNQAAFNVMMPSLRAEYARIINQPNLTGVLSDTARKEVGTTIPDDATVGQIKIALKFLKAEGQNRIDSVQDQVREITQTLKSGSSDDSKKTPSAASIVDDILKP